MGAYNYMYASVAAAGENERQNSVAEAKKKKLPLGGILPKIGKDREPSILAARKSASSDIHTNQKRLGDPNLGRQRLLS